MDAAPKPTSSEGRGQKVSDQESVGNQGKIHIGTVGDLFIFRMRMGRMTQNLTLTPNPIVNTISGAMSPLKYSVRAVLWFVL